MGPDLFKRWMDMLFWWLPRDDSAARREDSASNGQKPEAETPPAQEPRAAEQPAAASQPSAAKPEPATEPEPAPEQKPAPKAEAKPAAPPEPKPKPEAKSESAQEQPPKPSAAKAEEAPVDDLTAIKGIGPAMAARLQDLGVRTFDDLAAADVKAITQSLRDQSVVISEKKVEGWSVSAREKV